MIFFQSGYGFIQSLQRNVNNWISAVPPDAVWGCVKNGMASFVVSTVFSEGNVVVGIKAAYAASIASFVHTSIVTVVKGGESLTGKKISSKHWSYIGHGAFFLGVLGSNYLGSKEGISWKSLMVVVLIYLMTHAKTQPAPTFSSPSLVSFSVSTPLFLMLVRPHHAEIPPI